MAGDLRIFVLGGFRAEVGDRPVADEAWRRSGAAALVKLLAVQPGHRMHREHLIDILWPDLDAAAGARRLTKALHFARRALSTGQVRLRDDLLSLEADDLWVDVDAFEAAALRGDTEQALTLYAGDLLPENRFDDWAELRRAEVRARLVRLLFDHGVAREACGDHRGAVESFERLVAVDPVHEEAYGRLMRLAAREGHRHLAVRWYGRLVERLREELGVEPNEDLRRLYSDIVSGRLAPQPAEPVQPAQPPQPAPVPLTEERKLVTVLAADVRGTPDPDPERARRDAAAWTDVLCEVADRWGGAVERLVGGGVVAVFGYPAAREDHAARALWAGFEILRRVPVIARVGVDTGEVIAPAGSGLGTVGGGVLDVAARLREAAAAGRVLATERTRRAARGEFRFGRAVRVGRSGTRPLLARRLVAADWTADRPPPRAEPPMVGRDDETRVVSSLIDEAAGSERPRLLTIVGVAGVGKSRLVREVVSAAVRRRPDIRVVRGRCLAAGDGVTYWALGEILRDACGIALSDPAPVAERKLRDRLRQLLRSEVDDTLFALAATAAIPVRDNPLDDAAPRAVADALARAWPRFASAAASNGPLIMVVEDLHWAGRPLLDMLVRLVTRSAGPVVVLSTARPEFLEQHPGFGAASADVSMISLRSLTERSSRDLLDSLPGASALDAERREALLARADGNPYFLEQLVAHGADGAGGELPDSLHALLAARVDALPVHEKRLLQTASVVGRAFWVMPLRGRLDFDPAEPLTALEHRGLILVRPTSTRAGQLEFAFKHALLRDVAYASLPLAERAHGHAEVAAWLEETSQDRVGEVMELVAYHYAAAADELDEVRPHAFRTLMEAGVGARRRYAINKAVELHRRALGYASGLDERVDAVEAIGDDHEVAFDGDAAVEAWQAAIELLRQDPRQPDRRAALCLKTAMMAGCRWGGFRVPADPALTERVVDEGLSVVRAEPAKAQLLILRALCAARWSWTGRPDPVPVAERRRAAEEGRRLADRLHAPPLQGLALRGAAAVHLIEGAYEDAVTAMLDQIALFEQGGHARDLALSHAIAAIFIADIRGDYEGALVHAHRSYEIARGLFPHDRMHGTYFVMACLERLGRWSELEPYLEEHRGLLDGPEVHASCPYIRGGPLLGALALARLGEVDRARELADATPADLRHPTQAEAVRAELEVELGDAGAGRELAARIVRLNRRPAPEEIPHEALALVEALEAGGDHAALAAFLPAARAASGYLAVLTPTCDRAEGRAKAAAGDRSGARALLERAVAGFDRMALPLPAARTREHLATVSPAESDTLLRAALSSYERLGARRDIARLSAAWPR